MTGAGVVLGQIAVVTGGGSSIGANFALALAEADLARLVREDDGRTAKVENATVAQGRRGQWFKVKVGDKL